MEKIALVIPTYNCSTQLIRVLTKIEFCSQESIDCILIIDNLSQNEHVDKIKIFLKNYSLNSKTSFFQNKYNLGLGATFKRSWLYLKNQNYDKMIFLHGDDQADLNDYVKIKDSLPNSILFGARFLDRSKVQNYSRRREWVNIILNSLLSILTKKKIWEIGSGLNTYKLQAISDLDILNLSNHIAFDLELLILCVKKNIPFSFFPISWKSEDEESTISELAVGLNLLKIIICYAILGIQPSNAKQAFPIKDGWNLIND